jgi:ABC-type multidrug transport system ATPase subunit
VKELLTVRDLTVEIGGNILSRGVTFSLAPGDLLHVVGDNGSGKTTLLRSILGYQPFREGTVEFSFPARVGGSVGYLPQRSESTILPWLSVRENLALGLRLNSSASRLGEAFLELWSNFIEDRQDLPTEGLSGGERQRLAILRTFLSCPVLVLLDEPFRELDYMSVRRLRDFVGIYRERQGGAVILVSHQEVDMGESLRLDLDKKAERREGVG